MISITDMLYIKNGLKVQPRSYSANQNFLELVCLILAQNKGWIVSFVPSSTTFYDCLALVAKHHGADQNFTLQIKKGGKTK